MEAPFSGANGLKSVSAVKEIGLVGTFCILRISKQGSNILPVNLVGRPLALYEALDRWEKVNVHGRSMTGLAGRNLSWPPDNAGDPLPPLPRGSLSFA